MARLILVTDPSGNADPEVLNGIVQHLTSSLEREGYCVTQTDLEEVRAWTVHNGRAQASGSSLAWVREFGARQGVDGVAIVRVDDPRKQAAAAPGQPIMGCNGPLTNPALIHVESIDLVTGRTHGVAPIVTLLAEATSPNGLEFRGFTSARRLHQAARRSD